MAKVIDYKKVEMTDDEFQYYKNLVKMFTDEKSNIKGSDFFRDTFEVDESGFITVIKTDKSIPWAVLFFLQQIMISQRTNIISKFSKRFVELEDKVKRLEKKIKVMES